jgi:hypothetical protein
MSGMASSDIAGSSKATFQKPKDVVKHGLGFALIGLGTSPPRSGSVEKDKEKKEKKGIPPLKVYPF